MAHPLIPAAPAEHRPTGAPGHRLARRDRETAGLLHEVLDCDVTALMCRWSCAASIWLMVWDRGTTWAEVRRPLGDPLVSVLAARMRAGLRQGATTIPADVDLAPVGPHGTLLTGGLVIPLVMTEGQQTAWLLGRSHVPFSASDLEHACLLAPGLQRRLGSAEPEVPPAAVGRLTHRELAVLALVAQGLTAHAIAHQVGISERTVHKHLQNVYAKLGCRDRLSAVLHARRAGVFPG